jgi:hypothetical protein
MSNEINLQDEVRFLIVEFQRLHLGCFFDADPKACNELARIIAAHVQEVFLDTFVTSNKTQEYTDLIQAAINARHWLCDHWTRCPLRDASVITVSERLAQALDRRAQPSPAKEVPNEQ